MHRGLKRLLVRYLYPLAQLYWFIFRPKTRGVKCLIFHSGKVLLIKLNYGHQRWAVPGGGVHAGESPEAAVRRELMEELGISLQEIKQIGSYSQVIEYKQDTVDVFVGTTASEKIAIDEVELVEAQWFPFDMLPSDRGTQVDRIVAMYRS